MIYILLKDTPELKAGAMLRQPEGKEYYTTPCDIKGYGGEFSYLKQVIENSPEWFRLSIEIEPSLKDCIRRLELISEYALEIVAEIKEKMK